MAFLPAFKRGELPRPVKEAGRCADLGGVEVFAQRLRGPGGRSAVRSRGRQACAAPFLAVALAWSLLGCGVDRLEEVPPVLLGRWRTDVPGYEDRWLEIRPRALVWGMQHFPIDVHPIRALELVDTAKGRDVVYRFHYRETGDLPGVLEVRLWPGPRPFLHLNARRDAWTRAPG